MPISTSLERAIKILEKSGFYVAHIREFARSSFDIIARRDDLLIMLRVIRNIDSLSKEICNELKIVAHHLRASVIIVGEKSTTALLESGVMYKRYEIPVVNLESLEDLFLYGIQPLSHSAHGGFYVAFDGKLLKTMRSDQKIPLSTLAEKAGVSKRAIQMYEDGMDVSIDAAIRLEDFLGASLIKSTDILSQIFDDMCFHFVDYSKCDTFEKDVMKALEQMGSHVIPIYRCPFNALMGEQDSIIITGITQVNPRIRRRIEIVSKISRISERRSMFVVDQLKSKKNVGGTPLVGRKEIENLSEPDDIDQLLENRSKRSK
jgi:putative transcriptional regulator